MHFRPAANVELQRKRKQGTAQQHHQQHCSDGRILDRWKTRRLLKIEKGSAHNASHNHHRMQADDTAFEESAHGHPVPTVIISIADNKTGKHEEEIHCQITMIDNLSKMAATCMCFKKMEDNNHDSRHATKSVKNLIMRFRGKISSSCIHFGIRYLFIRVQR